MAESEPPIIIIPVGVDDDALDACLAALDAHTPAGTRVWLADDAQAGPRGQELIRRWLAATALHADCTRRQRPVGEVAHLDEVLRACADCDVIVLASDAQPLPGWYARLTHSLRADGAIASVTPWCNAGETVSWPRIGEINAVPADPAQLARAAAAMPGHHAELPNALTHAVVLRGSARQRAGGLDTTSYQSWYAALIDLSLRLSGLGWRNVLCETAFVARQGEGGPADGDLDALAARWPAWHARVAHFLMDDPLHATRAQLATLQSTLGPPEAQGDLFA
ncbi:glycosyltransferase family 2 protein [Agrilutibacter solisilvae]|uniref:Glycosyltransferase n=1 Tax=Agrilutibacter solisilvae TaxID=2763317 RepID=A0A974Y1I6_9GAMM|nr:glycosyltransferase [Lysobacter solisilvae]QSX79731.1 glycosyltransferase [Lysobacter solisilvae]